MLKIKLKRVGKKKNAQYRLIINEHTKDPWGDYLENLGTINPHTKEVNLKVDRIKEYLANGAQTSKTVHNLFVAQGIIDEKKKPVSHISNKRRAKMDEVKAKEAEEKAAAEEKAKAEENADQNADAADSSEAEKPVSTETATEDAEKKEEETNADANADVADSSEPEKPAEGTNADAKADSAESSQEEKPESTEEPQKTDTEDTEKKEEEANADANADAADSSKEEKSAEETK